MTVNGVHFNEKVIVGMSKKQFIQHAKHGTPHFKEKDFEDAYDKIVKDANDSKPIKGGTADGPK